MGGNKNYMDELEDGFMGVDLLKHNQEAFHEINKMIESGTKKIAVPRATGSGKTYLMGALAEKYNDEPKLVLEPTRPLLNSIKEKFDEFGIGNTDFITYQKLIRMSDEDIADMDYKLIFLDECHHGTAPIWGQKINHLMETHLDSIIFGTSATTVRNDGTNVIESLFEGNAIGELPLSTAIARKVLPCPHYITAIYRLDDEFEKLKKRIESSTNTKTEKREFYKKMQTMKLHFEKSYGVPLILNKYIRVKNGRYLVFCKNKKHLDAMRDVVIEWFHTAGIKDVHSYAVYSDYPDKEKDYKDFQEDNSDSAKILFSINMLNEGVHVEDISGVLMLRTTQSNLIYLQQLGRLVEAENLDKYLVVFDFVNNFSSVNDGIGLLKEIKDSIAKEKESNPDFDDSRFGDIDTFFVIDQVIEIQEMFREIEERLEGREWTEEEDSILFDIYPTGGADECIKRIPYRTRVAISIRANSLGIITDAFAKRKRWNEKQIKFLTESYENPDISMEEIEKNTGMTKTQIKSKAHDLNLKRTRGLSREIIESIRKEYPDNGVSNIVNRFNIPASVIYTYASKNNISRNRKSIFSDEIDECIRRFYPKMGVRCIELMQGLTKKQVKARAEKLGVKVEKKKYKYVNKEKGKYVVQFFIDGKKVRFGTFDSEEEAAKVAMEKAKEYGKAI